MRMKLPDRSVGLALISVCLLGVLMTFAAACGSSQNTSSTSTPVTAVSTTGTEESTSTTLLSELDQELAKTARAQNTLSALLEKSNASKDDPRFALVYALHARAQALGCVQLLNKGDDASLKTANAVMLDIYHLLNLARDAASGAVVDKLATARAVADKIGAPSDHVDEAKTLLLQFISASAPLVDEAASEAGSTTTVTS